MGGRGSPSMADNFDWLRGNMSRETTLIVNTITGVEHNSFNATCNNIPFYFDERNRAAASGSKALTDSAQIPSTLTKYIEGAQLVREDKPGSPDTIAEIEYGVITIFGNRQIDVGVIAHESAHPFAFDKWGSTKPPPGSDYKAAIDSGERRVSAYAHTSDGEDFAESVRFYITNPTWVQKIAPLRYNVIKRLMEDPDYGG